MRKPGLIFLVACAMQTAALCDPPVLNDTVGPDDFWFVNPDVTVAKDSTNATVWVDFSPGNRSWIGAVSYRTTNGTAIAPADYTPVSERLGFGWIQRPLPIHIPIHCDSATDGEMTFKVELFDPSGYPTGIIDGTNPAIVRMMDNTNGIISFATTRQSVLAEQGDVTIRVVRTGTPNGTISVNYRTGRPANQFGGAYPGYLGSTAWPGDDYVETNGLLTFGPGETEKLFMVTVRDMHRTEPPLLKIFLSEDFGPDFHLSAKILDLVIVPTPSLRIEEAGDQLKISWPNHGMPFVLERSPDVSFQQQQVVPHATNAQECIAVQAVSLDRNFYRLRQ